MNSDLTAIPSTIISGLKAEDVKLRLIEGNWEMTNGKWHRGLPGRRESHIVHTIANSISTSTTTILDDGYFCGNNDTNYRLKCDIVISLNSKNTKWVFLEVKTMPAEDRWDKLKDAGEDLDKLRYVSKCSLRNVPQGIILVGYDRATRDGSLNLIDSFKTFQRENNLGFGIVSRIESFGLSSKDYYTHCIVGIWIRSTNREWTKRKTN